MSYFPKAETITIGGRVFTDISTNLLILKSYGNTTNHFCSFAKQDGTFYSVTNGKTLTVAAIEIWASTANNQGVIAYGDSSVGYDSSSGPANPVYEFSSVAGLRSAPIIYTVFSYVSNFMVPSTKFPFFNNQGSGMTNMTIYGYES